MENQDLYPRKEGRRAGILCLGKLNSVRNSGKKMKNDCSAWRLQKPCAVSDVKDTWIGDGV